MLVPVLPPAAAARAVCRFSAASSPRDVGTRLAAAALTWATGAALLRDRVVIDESVLSAGESMREHLSGVLGEPVSFSLAIGPPRVNRKPVLQVFDRRGRSLAFAKVGDSPQARSDVRDEGAHLGRLAEHSFHTLVVPTVLDISVWNGMDVLVMSALPAGPRQAWGREVTPSTAMAELVEAYPGASLALVDQPWLRRQQEAVAAMTGRQDPGTAGLVGELDRCVRAVVQRYGDRLVTVGAWHGDWTPWNMARRRNRVLLWDWERFETDVPAGLDAWHYRVNVTTRRLGMSPAHVLDGVTARGHDPMVADLYLLAITCRYLSLLGAARGDDVRPSAIATLTALRARLATNR